jgi:Na+/H+ antiporter NhaC
MRDDCQRKAGRASLLAGLFFLVLACPAGLLAAELEVPSVMLKGIAYQLPVSGAQGIDHAELTLVVDGRVQNAVSGADGPVFEQVVATRSGVTDLVLRLGGSDLQSLQMSVIPAWISILPPMLAIGIALLLRSVLPALVIGLWAGAWALEGLTLKGAFVGLLTSFEVFVTNAMADRDHTKVILFTFMVAGMVGIISRNGGMRGIVNIIVKGANTAKRGQLAVWALGLVIFFDDYANTLVVGNTSRSVTDKLKISREKLAYIVDSTAAPVATVALVTTWIGYQVGLIGDSLDKIAGLSLQPYSVFLNSILYSFYPFLAILLVLLIITTGREFGPMLLAEKRARSTGQVSPSGVSRLSTSDEAALEVKPGVKPRALNAAIPVVVMAASVMVGLYVTGEGDTINEIIGSADSYTALMWASLLSAFVAAFMTSVQRLMSMEEIVEAWISGARFTFIAMMILVLAWGLSDVSSELHTADFLMASLGSALPYELLPTIVFVLSAFTAFATGSSWGAMGILMPLVVPLSWAVLRASGAADPEHYFILYSAVSCVLTGAVWGDHCSPISDTTVLSSLASGCDHIEHVRTQMPYALLAGAFAILLGTVPTGYGMPWWLAFLISATGMALALRLLGKRVEEPEGA